MTLGGREGEGGRGGSERGRKRCLSWSFGDAQAESLSGTRFSLITTESEINISDRVEATRERESRRSRRSSSLERGHHGPLEWAPS